jgi:hypothetical protein
MNAIAAMHHELKHQNESAGLLNTPVDQRPALQTIFV